MFDRIIVSTDENRMFLQFVPIVSAAWKKYFPDAQLTVALLTSRDAQDPLVLEVKKWADVRICTPVDGVPLANQAKLARFFVASSFKQEVCMIEDIDTIPLQKEYFYNATSQREPGKLLAVGKNVLDGTPHEGKFPISTMTAEGFIFEEIFNPERLNFSGFINTFCRLNIFDHKEDVLKDPNLFSDESATRALISKWSKNKNINFVDRNVDIQERWIDRSWWPSSIDAEKLKSNYYVTCNFLRPLSENFSKIKPIADFIFENNTVESEVVLKIKNN
jgi:hypothetical protein